MSPVRVEMQTERVMETSQLDCQKGEEGTDVVTAEEAPEPGITIEWLQLADPCMYRNLKCEICEKTFSTSNF